ncbi:hypothetical protein TNCV_3031101 [Trichonephila clavipes]|nr:hypothetical protein TNCV_3031101 [Trichonephila clavipes]
MTVMDHAANHEPQHSRFSLLSIIRCPLVPFDAVFRRVEMSARLLIYTTPNIQCYICEVLEPVILPYIQCLPSAIFQPQSAQPHVERNVQEFFFAHPIGLLPWPACSSYLSPIENEWFMGEQRLDRYTPSAAT